MIVDGRKLADDLVSLMRRDPVCKRIAGQSLAAIVVGGSEEIASFVRQKQRVGQGLGIPVRIHAYPKTITLAQLVREIHALNVDPGVAGIIVQLPLPEHVDVRQVFNAIAIRKDSDALSDAAFSRFCSGASSVIPPVAGAIKHIIAKKKIPVKDKFAVVLGAGRLVGMPVLSLFSSMKLYACSFQDWNEHTPLFLKHADIIVSGIGRPHIITGNMVKPGVVVFDAGYGFWDGKSAGDVDFSSVQPKASFITPVPGGIGPLTVAFLFHNIIELNK